MNHSEQQEVEHSRIRAQGLEETRDDVWKVLCSDFFQRYVCADDVVLDLGAGECCFINNIRCKEKHAVDMLPELASFAGEGVVYHCCKSEGIAEVESECVDVVFTSNFLEHLADKEAVKRTLREAWRVLKAGGRILILQPNARLAPGAYWDPFEHRIPLTERSVVEALKLTGFEPRVVIPRFMPWTMRSMVPKSPFLVKMYLRLPILWRVFGRQSFVLAEKRG